MNEFALYLAGLLEARLRRHRVVVFYDPRQEFVPFFDELEVVGEGVGGVPRVVLNDVLSHWARFDGSYLALRRQIEPLMAMDAPEPLLVYLPAERRDLRESFLMEAELAGDRYEPQLRQLAQQALRRRLTDGQIDELLRGDVSYGDIVRFCQMEENGTPSVLRAVLGTAASEQILVQWLVDPGWDEEIERKGGRGEVLALLRSRVGLSLEGDPPLLDARRRALRYILVNEFRGDFHGEPPQALNLIPPAPSSEAAHRIRTILDEMRSRHPDVYASVADVVETELSLGALKLDASLLGTVDTFRFEEELLLGHVAELLAMRSWTEAMEVVEARHRSFWADRELLHQAQWEASRRICALGAAVEEVRGGLGRPPGDVAEWVRAYAAPDGWHRMDRLYRDMEGWCAAMLEEPLSERALMEARSAYAETLQRMAEGFTDALAAAGWALSGGTPQTKIFQARVDEGNGPVALVLVDAFRYEMGLELRDHLEEAEELVVEPALASLPSVTPVGMAALLPGANIGFSVVEAGGELAARVEGVELPGWAARWKYWKARKPGVKELTLSRILEQSPTLLVRAIEGAPLLLVRSQEIDLVGESEGSHVAHQVMASVTGNLARGIRKLARAGILRFVVVADHGYLFSTPKEDDMKLEAPGGDTVCLHRRCWAGRGGKTPEGAVRVSAPDLGYDSDLDFVFPKGLGVFKAGGGSRYHHGGASLQELVIPVLTVRMPSEQRQEPEAKVLLRDVPEELTNRTMGVRVALDLGLFVEPVWLRVSLMAGGEEVGRAGMAMGGEIDRGRGTVLVAPDTEVSVGLVLQREDCTSVRVVVRDPETDSVLAQSDEIPVRLTIG